MSDRLLVKFDQLESIGNELVAAALKFDDRTTQLISDILTELGAWEGDTSDAFKQFLGKWEIDAKTAAAELEAMGNCLKAIRNRFYSIELDVEANWVAK
jgi:uncharacterized protein YukE